MATQDLNLAVAEVLLNPEHIAPQTELCLLRNEKYMS